MTRIVILCVLIALVTGCGRDRKCLSEDAERMLLRDLSECQNNRDRLTFENLMLVHDKQDLTVRLLSMTHIETTYVEVERVVRTVYEVDVDCVFVAPRTYIAIAGSTGLDSVGFRIRMDDFMRRIGRATGGDTTGARWLRVTPRRTP